MLPSKTIRKPDMEKMFSTLGSTYICEQSFLAWRSKKVNIAAVVRASDSRLEGLGSMLDATKYPPSTHGVRAR
ncbi:hypothetical protein TNCV_1729891 [Trichonephila clavipes]|nr:hypothetical protein TNCV_1729891 [Trichonephila clavipes]